MREFINYIILGKCKRDEKGFFSAEGFGILNFYEPVLSHVKQGAADHCSVDQDALFESILSTFGTESY